MNNDQMNLLKAALERAAATLRGQTPNAQVADRFGEMQPPAQPTPNEQVAARFGEMAPPSPQLTPNQQVANRFPDGGLPSWLTGANVGIAHSGGFATPADLAQAQHVPTPHARPAAAPAPAPAMSWFQRNALMQKDPITGQFIDPAGAARAMRG